MIIDDLRAALVGKTVVRIENSYRPGIICEVFCESEGKKSSFFLTIGEHKLHVLSPEYKNIGQLFDAVADYRMYAEHAQKGVEIEDLPKPKVEITPEEIIIDAFDGTKFSMKRDKLQPGWQTRVFSHPEAILFIPDVVDMSYFWHMMFVGKSALEGLPKELIVETAAEMQS